MFCVVIYQSFDSDTPVYLFDDETEAKAFLKRRWESSLREERKESVSGVNEQDTSFSDEYARITWNDGEYADFILLFAEYTKNKAKTFTVTYMATGGVEINADNEEEARDKFESMLEEDNTLANEMLGNGIGITDVYENE